MDARNSLNTTQAAQYVGGLAGRQIVAPLTAPDFIIKYDLPPQDGPCSPTPNNGHEEAVHGVETDAVEAIRRLIEAGRTTPGRVRLYVNAQAVVEASVLFPPERATARK